MFDIELTPEATDDLRALRRYHQRQIVDAIQSQLLHQPDQQTRNRKQLRPNRLAEWELRVGDFRVFYDVDAQRATVKVEAIGRKQGNVLSIRGEEFSL